MMSLFLRQQQQQQQPKRYHRSSISILSFIIIIIIIMDMVTAGTTTTVAENLQNQSVAAVHLFAISESRRRILLIVATQNASETAMRNAAYEIATSELRNTRLPIFARLPACSLIRRLFWDIPPCRSCHNRTLLPNCTRRDRPEISDPRRACALFRFLGTIYSVIFFQWPSKSPENQTLTNDDETAERSMIESELESEAKDHAWLMICSGRPGLIPQPWFAWNNATTIVFGDFPYSFETPNGCAALQPAPPIRHAAELDRENRTLATFESGMIYTFSGNRIDKRRVLIDFLWRTANQSELRWGPYFACYADDDDDDNRIYLSVNDTCMRKFIWSHFSAGYVARDFTYLFNLRREVVIFASKHLLNIPNYDLRSSTSLFSWFSANSSKMVMMSPPSLGVIFTYQRYSFDYFFGFQNYSDISTSHSGLEASFSLIILIVIIILIISAILIFLYSFLNCTPDLLPAKADADADATKNNNDTNNNDSNPENKNQDFVMTSTAEAIEAAKKMDTENISNVSEQNKMDSQKSQSNKENNSNFAATLISGSQQQQPPSSPFVKKHKSAETKQKSRKSFTTGIKSVTTKKSKISNKKLQKSKKIKKSKKSKSKKSKKSQYSKVSNQNSAKSKASTYGVDTKTRTMVPPPTSDNFNRSKNATKTTTGFPKSINISKQQTQSKQATTTTTSTFATKTTLATTKCSSSNPQNQKTLAGKLKNKIK